jgi:hypothetical protein
MQARSTMRTLIGTLLIIATPVALAQTNGALETIVEGWAKGGLELFNLVRINPETGTWETGETTADFEKVGPRTVKLSQTRPNGEYFEVFIELSDGKYTRYGLDDSGNRTDVTVSELESVRVQGPDNWTLRVRWGENTPQFRNNGPSVSELAVFGNVFFNTGFSVDPESGELTRRVLHFWRRTDID